MAKTKKQKEKKKMAIESARTRADKKVQGFERTCIKVPEGTNFFQVKKEGTKKIEIIPYTVGKGNPNCKPDKLWYECTYFNHRDIGPDGASYVCPNKTSKGKRKCPICEHRAKLMSKPDQDEDTIKALAPKERQLFFVFDHAEPEKGVQLWDFSYHLFGKQLDAKVHNSEDDDGYEFFADPENGLTLRVGFTEESMGKFKFYKCSDIDFRPRKEELDSDLLEKTFCLEDCIVELDYKKLKEIFLQTGDDDDEEEDDDEDDTKKKKKGKKAKDEDEDEEDEDDDSEEDDSDDDDEEEDDDTEDDDDDDDDDEPKAKKGSKKKKVTKKKSKKDDDDDDDSEEDDEEDSEDEDNDSEDDDEDEEDDDEDEENEKPKKGKKDKAKPVKKGKKKKKDEDEDDDDLPFDDDEDEEEDEDDDD